MRRSTEERFWSKVVKGEGCWEWTGSLRNKGYGAFVYAKDGQVVQGRAHRYSYELHVGEIPAGLFVLHRCDNPLCVNPSHLFLGTNADNVADMMRKGRHVSGGTRKGLSACKYRRGSASSLAKLNEGIVRDMREDYRGGGYSFSKLSSKYGISGPQCWRIVRGRAWAHVD